MKIIDLEDHWQPVRSAILATAGLLVNIITVAGSSDADAKFRDPHISAIEL